MFRKKRWPKAREIAARENLPLTYEVADLNFIELPPKAFDLVVAQTSLHHVLFLEKVAENKRGERSRMKAIFGFMISSARRRASTIRNVWR